MIYFLISFFLILRSVLTMKVKEKEESQKHLNKLKRELVLFSTSS